MKYYVIMLFCVTTTIVTAANKFMGKVVDENNNPLAFVNAILLSQPDSTFIDGGITDDNGDFSLSGNITNAIIKLSCLGYETKHIKTSSFQLGTIAMKPEATLLNEVVVKAVIPTHKLTAEGIKTDVDGTLLSKVGSANDVLENLPGVQKKNDGIEVFGKGTPLIYINGRELRNKNELEQLKSEDIKSVELITNPGAKYKADVESVILIKTKRPQGEGLSFNTQASYYQCDNTDLTLGINWNYRKGGLDVFGSEWYNEERWDQNDLIRLDVQADTSWVLNEQLKGKSLGRSLYNSIGVNYVLNDNHSMGLRYDTKWVFKDRDWGNMTADIIANDDFFDYLVNTVKHNTKSNMPHTFNAYYNG
ncbi:MAG: carboxypeptidase-like regulatory domain-containing protein, partial [Muribaculaceae bacterium]|nr:carboxypeptidase-like regulatory domain-containing protein [Muribaculaceae bacterium]